MKNNNISKKQSHIIKHGKLLVWKKYYTYHVIMNCSVLWVCVRSVDKCVILKRINFSVNNNYVQWKLIVEHAKNQFIFHIQNSLFKIALFLSNDGMKVVFTNLFLGFDNATILKYNNTTHYLQFCQLAEKDNCTYLSNSDIEKW